MREITYLEACDFESYPMGGTLTFAKQLIDCLPDTFNLVGFVNSDEPVGEWFLKDIKGTKYPYFGICSVNDIAKTKIPKRLYSYWALRKHIYNIFKNPLYQIFTQTPQFVFVLGKHHWVKFYFLFAGLGNSVGLSKYKYLRFLGSYYEKRLFKYLKKSAHRLFAASDLNSIQVILHKYNLPNDFITPFPTRFDSNVFKVESRIECRKKLNLSEENRVFITTGRLSYIKGWRLMIDSFRKVQKERSNLLFIILGDGEDRTLIEKYCKEEIANGSIMMGGRKTPEEVATYLNASDVFVMASLLEGWPTSMVEALGCGKPIVTTLVSGANEMIVENRNGYITAERNVETFSSLLSRALNLSNPNPVSIQKSKKYSTETLGEDFKKVWANDIY